jgi:two-component system OmpR family response regulator
MLTLAPRIPGIGKQARKSRRPCPFFLGREQPFPSSYGEGSRQSLAFLATKANDLEISAEKTGASQNTRLRQQFPQFEDFLRRPAAQQLLDNPPWSCWSIFQGEQTVSTRTNEPSRILVVDDNQDAATALALLLVAAGYQVETSFDSRAALEKAVQFEPDACVLDINMPGMNGYELARRLREQAPEHPPVLATVTAYSDEDHLDRAADAGFDLHFTKPADPVEVIAQLAECVGR